VSGCPLTTEPETPQSEPLPRWLAPVWFIVTRVGAFWFGVDLATGSGATDAHIYAGAAIAAAACGVVVAKGLKS
jgi:hypothetical protein